MPAALRALRVLLFDPETFFREREIGLSPRYGAASALVVSLLGTTGIALVGWTLAGQVESVWATAGEPAMGDLCREFATATGAGGGPAGIGGSCALDAATGGQRALGSTLRYTFAARVLPVAFGASLLGWVIVAVVLYLLSAGLLGEGSFSETLAVAGWGTIPGLLGPLAFTAAALFVLQGVSFTGAPEVVAGQFEYLAEQGLIRALSDRGIAQAVTAAGVLGTLWQGYVWHGGLKEVHGFDRSIATVVAGTVVGLVFLTTYVW